MAELRTILDSGDISTLKMAPSTQAHNEGQIFYDDAKKTLSFHNDIPGVTLNIGQELYIKVINNSGSIIPNGSPVRHNGVSSGLPQIELAQANNFTNSVVLGITTHSIGIGAIGIATIVGVVGGIDTTALTTGVPLYLSPTVAGGITDVKPDIITQLGGFLDNSLDGELEVSIRSNQVQNTTFGSLSGQNSATYTNMGGGVDIVDYISSLGTVITPNQLTGEIDTKFSGLYRATFSWSGTATRDQDIVYWDLFDATNSTILYSYSNQVANNIVSDGISCSFSFPFEVLTDNVVIKIRARSTDPLQDITIERVSFDIQSIR